MTPGAPLLAMKLVKLGPATVASVRLSTGLNGTNFCTFKSLSFSSMSTRAFVTARSIASWFSRFAARQAILSTSSCEAPEKVSISFGSSSSTFFVSVPVLSLHRISMPAISSIHDKRCTIAFSRDSSRAPTARPVVTTTGIATGSTATMITNAVLIAWSTGTSSRMTCTKNRAVQTKEAKAAMYLATVLSSFCTLPCVFTDWRSTIVLPKKVSAPVLVTTASSSPCTTTAPLSTSDPGTLVTGRDSPVSELSSKRSGSPSPMRRPSHGTMVPPTSSTTSPLTSSRTGTSTHFPSRLHLHTGAESAFSALTAFELFRSPR
mmetsp:Transcript_8160/g.27099  ORF Transcript_8160/g.27099 Transcript_8160/m.27099 type:complete len:319 (+) Transcript_8160:1691-2647(+)